MKTLKDKKIEQLTKEGVEYVYKQEDVEKHLNKFYNDYWKESREGDKCKQHITCDELDYLMNKHFGSIVEIFNKNEK